MNFSDRYTKYDISPNGSKMSALKDNKIRLFRKSYGQASGKWPMYNVLLNHSMSDIIRAKKLCYVWLLKDNYTAELSLVFQNRDGFKISDGELKRRGISLKNKVLLNIIAENFGCADNESLEKGVLLSVTEDLSNTAEFATFRISK